MFPRELKNWKYKMQVGTTINLCDQRPADSRDAKWRWNAAPKLKLVEKENSALRLRRKCWWSSWRGRLGEGGPRNWERQEFPQQSVQRRNGYLCRVTIIIIIIIIITIIINGLTSRLVPFSECIMQCVLWRACMYNYHCNDVSPCDIACVQERDKVQTTSTPTNAKNFSRWRGGARKSTVIV